METPAYCNCKLGNFSKYRIYLAENCHGNAVNVTDINWLNLSQTLHIFFCEVVKLINIKETFLEITQKTRRLQTNTESHSASQSTPEKTLFFAPTPAASFLLCSVQNNPRQSWITSIRTQHSKQVIFWMCRRRLTSLQLCESHLEFVYFHTFMFPVFMKNKSIENRNLYEQVKSYIFVL